VRIYTALLGALRLLLEIGRLLPELVLVVDQVFGWQMENGNWANTVPGSSYYKDHLIQFCRGIIIILEIIRPLFGQFLDLQVRMH
jgi:hypothetical protein